MHEIDIFPGADSFGEQRPIEIKPVHLVLTIDQAAERLAIGRSLMCALVKSGDVESVRIGRLRRIPADALETFVASLRSANRERAA
jgi:excisionase family DNA binding protein